MVKLKNFQEIAVNQLVTDVTSLFESDHETTICVFQSPTGSGKTVMASQFINDFVQENKENDFCFVWISIGKGDLHKQSKKKIESILPHFTCSLVEDEFNGSRDFIERNEVVFINWEKINSKDRHGQWTSILMKPGEKTNLPTVFENTKSIRNVIMILDESHYGTDTDRANEIKALIGPAVIMNMSATPRYLPNARELAEKKAAYVMVPAESVIDEGMIKKEVIINSDLDQLSSEELSSQAAVLMKAFEKRIEIKELFNKIGKNINPLVLIQIPNATSGETKLEYIKEFLKDRGVTEENGKLGVWLSESDLDKEDEISRHDHPLEFLVFKQALDTGWDCPRAQILVKFRETRSETFAIQTVGRILRMPEQEHYGEDVLNTAYVYTNLENIIVQKEMYNPNIIKDLQSMRKEVYEDGLPLINSYYGHRVDFGSLTSSFIQTFEYVFLAIMKNEFSEDSIDKNLEKLKEMGLDLSGDHIDQALHNNILLEYKKIDEGYEYEEDEDGEKIIFNYSDDDIQELFETVLKANMGSFAPKRSIGIAKNAVYNIFMKYLGKEWENDVLGMQKVYLKNRDFFKPIFLDAIERQKFVHLGEVAAKKPGEIITNYQLPEITYHSSTIDEQMEYNKYLYTPCYLWKERSKPEIMFENDINQHQAIKWWWKNGEKKKEYFGIKYQYQNNIHTFYPDYVLMTMNNTVIMAEVKDSKDREGSTYTKAKAEAMQEFLRDYPGVIGGICIFRNGRWFINNKSSYEWDDTINDDWSDWEEFDQLL